MSEAAPTNELQALATEMREAAQFAYMNRHNRIPPSQVRDWGKKLEAILSRASQPNKDLAELEQIIIDLRKELDAAYANANSRTLSGLEGK